MLPTPSARVSGLVSGSYGAGGIMSNAWVGDAAYISCRMTPADAAGIYVVWFT